MKRLKLIDKCKYIWVLKMFMVIGCCAFILFQHQAIQRVSEQVGQLNEKVASYEIMIEKRLSNISQNNTVIEHKIKSSRQVEVQKLLQKAFSYYVNSESKAEIPNVFQSLVMFETEDSNIYENKQLMLNALFSSELGFIGWDEIAGDFECWMHQEQDPVLKAMLEDILKTSIQERI